MRIDAIPSNKLETVKDWLTSCKIKYYESKLNLAWKPILKSIVEDPKQFIADGAAAGAAGAGAGAGWRGWRGCGAAGLAGLGLVGWAGTVGCIGAAS